MKKTPAADELTFEQATARLEDIVRELDRGDLALERALELFQEGNALREVCERKLAEAEASVEQLLVADPEQGRRAPAAEPAAPAAASSPQEPAADSLFGDDDA
jgi:exodeoxyribonuclease VII small subunit